MAIDRELVQAAKAWPFQEARDVVKRLGGAEASHAPDKGYVLFETGYGPSGLPHIGTFGEVARTTMVRNAFAAMSDIPTRLIAFSDDMDGLRKVPENVPEQEMLTEHLGKPLTEVPDPFGTHDSFGAHNNARLQAFLDTFGFEYEFRSSTACYRAGEFDATLLKMLANYDAGVKDAIGRPDMEGLVRTVARTVPLDWLDYNGHMNEARYLQAFGDAAEWLAALEFIHQSQANQVVQANLDRQGAAAGVAGVAQALAVLLPGIEPINVGCGNQLWFHAAPQK